jgi:hypothetical protein
MIKPTSDSLSILLTFYIDNYYTIKKKLYIIRNPTIGGKFSINHNILNNNREAPN